MPNMQYIEPALEVGAVQIFKVESSKKRVHIWVGVLYDVYQKNHIHIRTCWVISLGTSIFNSKLTKQQLNTKSLIETEAFGTSD